MAGNIGAYGGSRLLEQRTVLLVLAIQVGGSLTILYAQLVDVGADAYPFGAVIAVGGFHHTDHLRLGKETERILTCRHTQPAAAARLGAYSSKQPIG